MTREQIKRMERFDFWTFHILCAGMALIIGALIYWSSP